MDCLYIWHGGRYWSKEFFCAIPTLKHDLGVKVTDSEFSEKNYYDDNDLYLMKKCHTRNISSMGPDDLPQNISRSL